MGEGEREGECLWWRLCLEEDDLCLERLVTGNESAGEGLRPRLEPEGRGESRSLGRSTSISSSLKSSNACLLLFGGLADRAVRDDVDGERVERRRSDPRWELASSSSSPFQVAQSRTFLRFSPVRRAYCPSHLSQPSASLRLLALGLEPDSLLDLDGLRLRSLVLLVRLSSRSWLRLLLLPSSRSRSRPFPLSLESLSLLSPSRSLLSLSPLSLSLLLELLPSLSLIPLPLPYPTFLLAATASSARLLPSSFSCSILAILASCAACAWARSTVLLWSSVLLMMEVRKRLFGRGAVESLKGWDGVW